MSAEQNTQVFKPGEQQPERFPTPDNKNLQKTPYRRKIFDFISIEKQATKAITLRQEKQQAETKGEKLTNAELALTLKTFKMEGLTSQITEKKFPDLTEDELEDAKYLADSVKAGNYRGSAKMTTDKELQKLLNKHADEVIKQRDERMKAHLEGKYGKTEHEAPVDLPKEILHTSQQPKKAENSQNPFGYL